MWHIYRMFERFEAWSENDMAMRWQIYWVTFPEACILYVSKCLIQKPMQKCNVKGGSGFPSEERIQRKGPRSIWYHSGVWQRIPEGQHWLKVFIAIADLLWTVKRCLISKQSRQALYDENSACLLKIIGCASNCCWPTFDLISVSMYWRGRKHEGRWVGWVYKSHHFTSLLMNQLDLVL